MPRGTSSNFARDLQCLVAGAGDDVQLLLTGQVDELHGVTGDADGEVLVLWLLGMLHGVQQHFLAEDIHIQVMCAPGEIAVKDVDQILGALPVTVAQGTGVDCLGVGNAVQGVLVGQLGNGVQRGDEAGLLRTVAGVGTGGQRGPGPAGPARKLSSPS